MRPNFGRLLLILTVTLIGLAVLAYFSLYRPAPVHADGAAPSNDGKPVTANVVPYNQESNAGGGAGALWSGPVGPATVLLGECTALPCLLELTINGKPWYIIVDYPNPRG